jgi:hypothetical protein
LERYIPSQLQTVMGRLKNKPLGRCVRLLSVSLKAKLTFDDFFNQWGCTDLLGRGKPVSWTPDSLKDKNKADFFTTSRVARAKLPASTLLVLVTNS